ncbi:MAG: ABC transporter ATP-binding protein [Phycisphaerae bacterium]|nr:ABC transporter ATP-binding protein [Phycisphaerae bacterium]
MANILEVRNLRKAYDQFTLKDISFHLPEGFVMGLVGPNGSGKTTIIKLIMNLIMKQSGDIKVFGQDHRACEAQIKARIGFVYETPNFYANLRLDQIASLIAPFYTAWDQAVFRRHCQAFQLPLDHTFKSLSKGMQMKFSLALALSHHADLLILDEPTSGLDPVFRREFLELLRDHVQDDHRAVLYSTHITSDLERIADYMTLLKDGEILLSLSINEIEENWGLIKTQQEDTAWGDLDVKGMRQRESFTEILTSDIQKARRIFDQNSLFEKASIEDIMFFLAQGDSHEHGPH